MKFGQSGVCHISNQCYTAHMSAVEMVIEKVKQLDEAHARQLLTWLQGQERAAAPARQPAGAMAMLGFARRFPGAERTYSIEYTYVNPIFRPFRDPLLKL